MANYSTWGSNSLSEKLLDRSRLVGASIYERGESIVYLYLYTDQGACMSIGLSNSFVFTTCSKNEEQKKDIATVSCSTFPPAKTKNAGALPSTVRQHEQM